MELALSRVDSPLGPLLLVTAGSAVASLDYAEYEERMRLLLHRRFGEEGPEEGTPPPDIVRRLKRYFKGDFRALDPQRLAFAGTPFQERVWQELRRIPAGETATYGEVAARLGMDHGASRAVGSANGANPIALFVPCHRVVGADGSLTGYAGGLERKQWLLRHEGAEHRGRLRQGSLF